MTEDTLQNTDSRLPFHPDRLLLPGLILGIIMIVLGIFIAGILRGDDLRRAWYPMQNVNAAGEILLGVGAGIFGMGIVLVLDYFVPPLRALRERIMKMLQFDALTVWHALAFGLLAGIPEEIFFRGALQPILGLVLTSLIFGALHAITRAYLIYAVCAGFYLGLIFAWRGDLWAVTAAHFTYDAGLFLVMAWRVRQNQTVT